MTDYTNIDVFHTLGEVAEDLLDTMLAVEGQGLQYDPADITQTLIDEENDFIVELLGGFAKSVYLMEMLTPDSMEADWLPLQQAKEDFETILRRPKRLAQFWPSFVEDTRALQKLCTDKERVYRRLMQPAYPNDLLTVPLPNEVYNRIMGVDI